MDEWMKMTLKMSIWISSYGNKPNVTDFLENSFWVCETIPAVRMGLRIGLGGTELNRHAFTVHNLFAVCCETLQLG